MAKLLGQDGSIVFAGSTMSATNITVTPEAITEEWFETGGVDDEYSQIVGRRLRVEATIKADTSSLPAFGTNGQYTVYSTGSTVLASGGDGIMTGKPTRIVGGKITEITVQIRSNGTFYAA